jgi:hypothetical protein
MWSLAGAVDRCQIAKTAPLLVLSQLGSCLALRREGGKWGVDREIGVNIKPFYFSWL